MLSRAAVASAAYARTSPRDGHLNVHARSCASHAGHPPAIMHALYEGEKKNRSHKRAWEGGREKKGERARSGTGKRDTSRVRTCVRRKDNSGLSRLFVNGWETAADFSRLLSSPYVSRTRVKRGNETSPRGKPRRHRSPPRSLPPSPFLSSRRDRARSSSTVDRRYKSSRWDQKPACIRRRCSTAPSRKPRARSRGQIIRCIISSLRMQHGERYIAYVWTSGRRDGSCVRWKYRARSTLWYCNGAARNRAGGRTETFRRPLAKLVKILTLCSSATLRPARLRARYGANE